MAAKKNDGLRGRGQVAQDYPLKTEKRNQNTPARRREEKAKKKENGLRGRSKG